MNATPPRFWLAAGLLGVALCYAGLLLHYYGQIGPYLVDDAFIFFRYADNFSIGHGLVYNPGEAVEGYTSFLWTLLLALAAWVGLPLIPFSQIAGVVFGFATLWAVWQIALAWLRYGALRP